jgi:23S rRNA pseudouridine2605 synthase
VTDDRVRLQKYLSRAGVASRRASERLIADGRVEVDGEVVMELGVRVDPDRSTVRVDGREVTVPEIRWILMNKPPAVMCTREDPQGRPTVYDLVPPADQGLFHVGRLDFMSEGLLLLTNEGDLANALLRPARAVPRRYEIELPLPVRDDLVERLLAGVRLDDGLAMTQEASIGPAGRPRKALLRITLTEGRNREIRRLLAALDVRINTLRRTSFGPIRLGDLAAGEFRPLTTGEVGALHSLVKKTQE